MPKLGNNVKKLITRCPFCGDQLGITRLSCHGCNTQIDSQLEIPLFFRLPPDLQEFVYIFLRCEGKIRDVEKELGISYPTVCKRLNLVNELLGNTGTPVKRTQILEQLERGEINVQEATPTIESEIIMNQMQSITFGQYSTPPLEQAIPVLLMAALFGLVCFFIIIPVYRRYTGFAYGQSVKLWACALCLTLVGLVFISTHPFRGNMDPFIKNALFIFLLSFFALPFAVQLYRKWIGGHLTEAEKLPGMDGVRAWLGKGNVICAVLISICAWQVFDTSLLTMFALTFGSLLAYPIFNLASASPQPAVVVPTEDLSNEREKVLQLLETGKITAEESAELLNALGQSVPPRPPSVNEREISAQRKIVLLGAALILVGFFLPWFSINPLMVSNDLAAQLRQRMANDMVTAQLQQNMNQMIPRNATPEMYLTLPNANMPVHAGDLAHGLGWWILALGVGVAALPFFATTLNAQMQKKVMLAALAIGAFLLIYLLSDSLRYVSIGIVLALAGYGLEFLGTLKERPTAR